MVFHWRSSLRDLFFSQEHGIACDGLGTALVGGLCYLEAPLRPLAEGPMHSVTDQCLGFRVRQHLVRHTAEQNPG